MRVLLTGARGLLGAAIAREFQGAAVSAFDHEQLDVTAAAAVRAAVDRAAPDLIVNCAAYNNVDEAESQAARALDVNAFAVLTLAQAAAARGATLVHYSSDFVFDGEAERPYTEDDRPAPRSVYAASKLLGDWFALEAPNAYVLRVESLFGAPGPGGARVGSLGTIVQRLARGEEVPVFVDRTVSPSSTADVAAATRALVESKAPAGLYHCVNTGAATWDRIAGLAAEILGLPLRIKPLTLETATLVAKRPRYCALSNAKLASAGVVMPTWQDALRRYLSAVIR
jgi:dTDP-4-dehydrorhamnose reductase